MKSNNATEIKNSITDIEGLRVGHAQNYDALTGCTVVLCESGATAGVDQRGGAPGTRETDLLRPMHQVEQVHAILLSGGSAFGLNAAGGVMRYLEERGIGYDARGIRVPIVPTAILFDLSLGDPLVRPDDKMAYQACLIASSDPPAEGTVGAGTGATVGNILGMQAAMKSGIGSASTHIGDGIVVAALVAVNSLGDVVDPANGQIIAGARNLSQGEQVYGSSDYFVNTLSLMHTIFRSASTTEVESSNTVIGVVATNARLTKEQVNKVAQMAQDGVARAIRPAHTMFDGDTLFALSMGDEMANVNVIGAWAAETVTQAIINGVYAATPIAGLPAASPNIPASNTTLIK